MERIPRERNPARTRARILRAATDLIAERGSAVSLAEIAAVAGVTKGGVTRHFPSRSGLLVAALSEAIENFRRGVEEHLDITENTPGKLTRAYIRALCGGSTDAMQFFASFASWSTVSGTPELDAKIQEDSDRWEAAFAADGLHPERVMVTTRAAESLGVVLVRLGDPNAEHLAWARNILLELTMSSGPLIAEGTPFLTQGAPTIQIAPSSTR
ncbi:MAG TPA: TetR/AcrR family transcriptional regulator [Pseudolysinimonas sp.]|nr:TetR/AcrR family transcriptional regulator [Pseudolysinimonas sp.]